jgi:DNA-binding NtrC family response regulator
VTLLKPRLYTCRALVIDINLLRRFSGSEAAHAARDIDPSFPVIHMSGVATDQAAVEGVPHGTILQRPFVPTQLVAAERTPK